MLFSLEQAYRSPYRLAHRRAYRSRTGGHESLVTPTLSEKNKGGGETQGRGKHTIKPLPENGLGPPPLMIRFPPPLCSRNVILLRGNGHRPDKSHFLRPPKLVLEGVLYGTFPPPPPKNRTIRFAPPPLCEFPTLSVPL